MKSVNETSLDVNSYHVKASEVAAQGLEHGAKSSGNSRDSGTGGAKSDAISCKKGSEGGDSLAAIADALRSLSPADRQRLAAMLTERQYESEGEIDPSRALGTSSANESSLGSLAAKLRGGIHRLDRTLGIQGGETDGKSFGVSESRTER